MSDETDKPGGKEPEANGSAEETGENERPTVSPPFDPIAFAKDILKPSSDQLAAVCDPKEAAAAADDRHTHATPAQGMAQQAAAAEASRRTGGHKRAVIGSDEEAPPRRKTPTSTLSLANARIPSNLPPRLDSPFGASSSAARPYANEATDVNEAKTVDVDAPPAPTPPAPAPAPPPPAPSSSSRYDVDDGPLKLDSLSSMNAVDREWADMEIATRPPPADSPMEDPVIEVLNDRPAQLDLDDLDLDEHDLVGAKVDSHDIEADSLAAESVPRFIEEDTAAKAPQPSEALGTDREREMNDRVSLGDYSGALEIAEKILSDDPDAPGAKACAENCRTVLRQMYATRIGPLNRVPVVMVPRDQLRWLSIDHKAGFVLSLVDGVSSLEMIIDVSGMPELDTLRILSELAQQRIISLR